MGRRKESNEGKRCSDRSSNLCRPRLVSSHSRKADLTWRPIARDRQPQIDRADDHERIHFCPSGEPPLSRMVVEQLESPDPDAVVEAAKTAFRNGAMLTVEAE